jgi:integrase
MATIGNDRNGLRRILFVESGSNKRKTVRLGQVSKRTAIEFKIKMEALIAAKITGATVDEEVSKWVAELDDTMHGRLAAVDLVKPREVATIVTLGKFVDDFIARKTQAKQNTLENWTQVKTWLMRHFGQGRDIRKITPADAEDFRVFMATGRPADKIKKLGDNTARRHIGRCREIFKAAIRRGVFRGANPFDGISATVRSDKARQFNVTREMADAVIAACPNTEWKVLVALSRYGGLRIPSEALRLKWEHVDWEKERIIVTSPKTEHHEGKESRIIPLFPELRKPLLDAFTEAGPNAEFVITRYRDAAVNLRTHFERIINKAGLTPWPKLWHNMRASRQTELAERYPLHVVCAWIGNSRAVAQEHYLQITDAHFAAANAMAAQQTVEMVEMVGKDGKRNADNGTENAFSCVGEGSGYPRQDSNL